MRALADEASDDAIGCTQATEIRYTPGLDLVGPLPAPFALATVYSAALGGRRGRRRLAARFLALLGGPATLELRLAGGFDPEPADAPCGALVHRPVAAADAEAAGAGEHQRQRREQVDGLQLERVAALLAEMEQVAACATSASATTMLMAMTSAPSRVQTPMMISTGPTISPRKTP